MSATKIDSALITDGYSISAENAGYTSSTGTITITYGSMILLSVLNGGTQTVGVSCQINASHNGTVWFNYGGALTASLTSAVTTSWCVPISIAVPYVQVVFVGATGNSATLYCHLESVSKI